MKTEEIESKEILGDRVSRSTPKKLKRICPRCNRIIEVYILGDGAGTRYKMSGCICGHNVFNRLGKATLDDI